ncbi:hypothetical protein [Streptomyces sp900105755]|uniref:Uncharacterized protein n=1 Tax=Streptomyces sp. 900105755 TaxID=3154389 RepID=A0ABV1T7D3_9ACTN
MAEEEAPDVLDVLGRGGLQGIGSAGYAVASIWAHKPEWMSWVDAAVLPSSVEAAAGPAAPTRLHRPAPRVRPIRASR